MITKHSIAFLDLEVSPQTSKVLDLGCVKGNNNFFHGKLESDFNSFIAGSDYLCGHNILNHDIKYMSRVIEQLNFDRNRIIDTLHLSPLLFPTNPYHALLKDDKLQTEELNNPLNDAIKAKDLFYDELTSFHLLDDLLKEIFYSLLHQQAEFEAFFRFIDYVPSSIDIENLIKDKFKDTICEKIDLLNLIREYPVELAYCFSIINTFNVHQKSNSITPPWVLKNYPNVERLMYSLRNKPCLTGCNYCNDKLDAKKGLKRFFGYDDFRKYDDKPLQENAVKAAIANQSLLAVFPTGGGKSITFQVPALMSGENARALTIVISPLQSLMKDQVDNLERLGITDAVTINGLLDPIERSKSFERVENGSASLLYISPESLRSKSIERLVLGRKIARVVIDEAHCFSSWGQDFRIDYLYIGDFIKKIQEKKNLEEGIPVSCFTATAKQNVIDDICNYFRSKLNIDLTLFTSKASRTNLTYKVFDKYDEEDKYQAVRDLIESKNCPTIIYVSRTKKAYSLAERLVKDGFNAKPYHGKMDKQEKSENQNSFISGNTQIMVATSAFGMGVDKKDVGVVIHYDISDSLENYVQEAGRAGRDENITAECFVLFNEEDLSKHFILLNQTKLTIKEIQQVWKAVKEITKFRNSVSNSALEIARKAGWDDNVAEIESRVTTAIAALEDAGYLKRGQNMPRVFANSILSKNAQEAIDKINNSTKFLEIEKINAVRIIKKLFSSKRRIVNNDEIAESRIDYISDHLGIVRADVIKIIGLLREEKILADTKDLTAFIKYSDNIKRSIHRVEVMGKIERFLIEYLEQQENVLNIKELNEEAEQQGVGNISIKDFTTIFNFWSIKNWIKRKNLESKNHVAVIALHSIDNLKKKLEQRLVLAKYIIDYLYHKIPTNSNDKNSNTGEMLIEFSVHELKESYDISSDMFKLNISIEDVEDALFYLSRIEALKIEGGFLVVYNRLTIERTELNNKKQYTKDDYQKLNNFYENKIQQIHIVGEYAKMMIEDYRKALQFVEDYFQLNYFSFLNKYFKGSRQNDIKRNITPSKFRQLFGELSPTQLKIINDNTSKYILVAAGPGSGKTRVLVHKLASLLLMEDVKHEQLLMITFSRAAATEFKKRLLKLIGNAANFIEIKTFHSYCFDLLGKVGNLEKAADIIQAAIQKIKDGEIEENRITKSVLVIDEAQDMDAHEFELISTLIEKNEEMRVIAVGDDDQNIYEFRGSNSKYLLDFVNRENAIKYELNENYRSKQNLVTFSNQFVQNIPNRLKEFPIIAHQNDRGNIKIVTYQNGNLIKPLVGDILNTDLSGTTCVLTQTNEEALQITGLLLKNNLKAKLIQTNDGFNLYNLDEVRFFINQLNLDEGIYIIQDEVWNKAKQALFIRYGNSLQYEVASNVVKEFEAANPNKKYKSDLLVLIRESKLEDFYSDNGEVIYVSTIHKAKGKEFDNVFIMLNKMDNISNEYYRLLYVAITRAKSNLSIHTKGNYFQLINTENVARIYDDNQHQLPNELVMQLSFKDVWLGYFNHKQKNIAELKSGDTLVINGQECFDAQRNSVLKFSKQFISKIESIESKGFKMNEAKINFIVFWYNEDIDKEIKVLLPEITFKKIIN